MRVPVTAVNATGLPHAPAPPRSLRSAEHSVGTTLPNISQRDGRMERPLTVEPSASRTRRLWVSDLAMLPLPDGDCAFCYVACGGGDGA